MDMDYSSSEDSDISNSDIESYVEKAYELITSQEAKVRISENSYRCPFCKGKKKQDYRYQDLLQHASGIGASSSRKRKEKANHRAVAKYLKNNLPKSDSFMLKKRESPKPKEEDKFVYPWMGVLVNLQTEFQRGRHIGGSGKNLNEELSRFNPVKVVPLWSHYGHTGNAIVTFSEDWNGFKDAMAFETHFKLRDSSKKDWIANRNDTRMIHGWVARENDFLAGGSIGHHLQKKGDLKTINQVTNERTHKTGKLVAYLTSEIDEKIKCLAELQSKHNNTDLSLEMALDQKEAILQAYNAEMQRMQCLARDHSKRMLKENKLLRLQVDSKRKELQFWGKQLNEYVTQNDIDSWEPVAKKHMKALTNKNLEMASIEQKKADEILLKLIQDHKREKEAALNKIIQLEKQLDAKQKLELETTISKGKMNVMKYMDGEGSSGAKTKMDDITE